MFLLGFGTGGVSFMMGFYWEPGEEFDWDEIPGVHKFTHDSVLVWKKDIGVNNEYISITPDAEIIAVGSFGLPFSLIMLDGEGTLLTYPNNKKVGNTM